MRASIDSKFVVKLFLFFLGIAFVFRALLWIPMHGFTRANWIVLAIGLIAMIFIDMKYRSACLFFSMFMAGVAGLMYVGAAYLDCAFGHALGGNTCFSIEFNGALKNMPPFALPFYCGCMIVGGAYWVMMRRKKRKHQNASPKELE